MSFEDGNVSVSKLHGKSENMHEYFDKFVDIECQVLPASWFHTPPIPDDFSNTSGLRPASIASFAATIPEGPAPIIKTFIRYFPQLNQLGVHYNCLDCLIQTIYGDEVGVLA